jgi:hypothetical protein
MMQQKMPDREIRKRLAIEYEPEIYNNEYNEDTTPPSVYHGWNKNYHSIDTAIRFLSVSSYFQSITEAEYDLLKIETPISKKRENPPIMSTFVEPPFSKTTPVSFLNKSVPEEKPNISAFPTSGSASKTEPLFKLK